MTLPGNGTVKRIVACVVGGIILFMAGAVLANKSSIAETSVRVDNNASAITLIRDQGENSRKEILDTIQRNWEASRGDYKEMRALLDTIARDVKK